MKNILDRVAKSAVRHRSAEFRPTTTQEYLALRLATKLGDAGAARHYAELADQHSEGPLLTAYGRALKSHVDLARRFHMELEPLRGKRGDHGWGGYVLAVRIERRAVAVAILRGDRLMYTDSRQLSSVQNKAVDSAASFVTRVLGKFQCESAALESIPNGQQVQRTLLHQAVLWVLSEQAIGIIEVARSDLVASFGRPALRFRSDVREIVADIYPALREALGRPWTCDAAALGLYVQTERLFNNINQSLL